MASVVVVPFARVFTIAGALSSPKKRPESPFNISFFSLVKQQRPHIQRCQEALPTIFRLNC